MVIYTMKYYSVIEKNEILSFVTTWMNLEGITLTKISQSQKDKYCTVSLCEALGVVRNHRDRK